MKKPLQDNLHICKVTVGYVVQTWLKKTGKFLGQNFIYGDDVSYEDENGNAIDDEEPEYQPYDMVQPDRFSCFEDHETQVLNNALRHLLFSNSDSQILIDLIKELDNTR